MRVMTPLSSSLVLEEEEIMVTRSMDRATEQTMDMLRFPLLQPDLMMILQSVMTARMRMIRRMIPWPSKPSRKSYNLLNCILCLNIYVFYICSIYPITSPGF